MEELAIAAVLKPLVISGGPAIAEKISSRNDDEVVVGPALDLRSVGGEGLSFVRGFQPGDELQVIAVEAI